ncbi:MAG: hypothetical protein P8O78_07505 [Flavobacteriaceae bacterium]|jgi:hypothetical protein|nr:hypothetical protein [Flavobacteriaceae bacterium]
MLKKLIITAFIALFFLTACSSSKQQFEKGNYEKAVTLSIKKLRKKPDNSKQKAILKAAYGYAVQVSEQKIKQQQQSTDRFKWDAVIAQYRKMQQLYTDLLQCPGCLAVVSPVDFQNELNEALTAGAQVYVEEGQKALATKEKEGGRLAYRHFAQAKVYQNNYGNIDLMLNDARTQGTEVIGVSRIPVSSKGLELNTAFFLQQLTQAMNDLNYFFAVFAPVEQLVEQQQVPDQVVDLSFDDYYIGQTYVKEIRESLVRDSVKVGEVTDSLGKKYAVYGEVKADLQRYEKTIESGGLLNIAIVDPNNQSILFQQKIPSTTVWKNDWATYQGDKRALTKEELALTREKELLPPPPQDLFYSFTRPLFDQTANLLRRRYRYLRQ